MKQFSLKYQILLITMVPVLLIDIFLTSVHINGSINQARELLQSKGEIIAEQIASASEYYLFSGNFDQIQHLLDQSIDRDDIIYSAVYDQQGQLIASAQGATYSSKQSDRYFYHRQSIQTQEIDSEDVFEPETDTNRPRLRILGWVHLYISPHRLQQQVTAIFTEGLLFFVVILFIASGLTAIISHRITRPVYTLLDHLKKVEKGDLGQVIKDIRNNEIGEVQKGFNSMSQSLLVSRTQLNRKIETATRELRNAVIDLEEKNHELGIARDAAQEANRVKSQFLANISHEIRTPINGIKGFVSLLSKTGLDPNQKRYGDIIHQSTTDLSAIINEVLDFSKMESGKVEIVEEVFDLFELVETTRDSLFTASMDKGIDLHLIIYSDTPQMLLGDPFRVKQILINLISNAIKFTDQGNVTITVMLEEQSDYESRIIFRVQDTGIGISQQDQQYLFQAFSQIETSSNRRYSGTGLGLVISKNLARLMGGDIELHSTTGEGAVFSLTLPFKSAPVAGDREISLDGQTALIYVHDELCQKEMQTLFDRAGVDTQTQLVEASMDIESAQAELRQNLAHIDFIIFDVRHCHWHASEIIDADIRQHKRVVVMHYDISLIDAEAYAEYEFMPVINTCASIRQQLSTPPSLATQSEQNQDKDSGKAARVLIVDDNPINLALATELTRLWGHQPFEASHARQAMKLFQQQAFDLILLDIQMPEIDGVELMKMMRRARPHLAAPIVAITANTLDSERQRLLTEGFNAYLGKPLEEAKLRALIEHNPLPPSVQSERQTGVAEHPDTSLNLDKSLVLTGNNPQIQQEMLTMLHQSIPDYQMQIIQACEQQSTQDLAPIIHKLHGVTCYTELPRLNQILSAYEAVKNSDQDRSLQIASDIVTELEHISRRISDHLAAD